MFPFSKNFFAGLLQQVCQLCEEQPGRDAEASDEKSYSLQKSSTFFLELELKEGVGDLQVQNPLFHILTGAGAGSSGWAWSGPVPHHPLFSLPLQGIEPPITFSVPVCKDLLKPFFGRAIFDCIRFYPSFVKKAHYQAAGRRQDDYYK